MSTETSARLGLPLLAPGQAQKEWFHNEALTLLDMTVQPSVVATGLDVPPAAPVPGQCWIVGDAPSGDWTARAGELAGWTESGWRFVVPPEGACFWDATAGCTIRRAGAAWVSGALVGNRVILGGEQVIGPQQPAISPPQGGSLIDSEARAALGSILAMLRSHGLIAS